MHLTRDNLTTTTLNHFRPLSVIISTARCVTGSHLSLLCPVGLKSGRYIPHRYVRLPPSEGETESLCVRSLWYASACWCVFSCLFVCVSAIMASLKEMASSYWLQTAGPIWWADSDEQSSHLISSAHTHPYQHPHLTLNHPQIPSISLC